MIPTIEEPWNSPDGKIEITHSDLTTQNIEKLAALFPNCVTEAQDEQGRVTQVIDFDQLRQELSGTLVEGPRERYHLDWPGKREAILAANAPIAKTLRPCREESVEFDSTQNLFIEGDNLDALKLLQETYLGKIRLIYIDPHTTQATILFTTTILPRALRPICVGPIRKTKKGGDSSPILIQTGGSIPIG